MTGLLFILNIVGIDNGKPVLLCNSEVFNIKNIAGSVIVTALLLLFLGVMLISFLFYFSTLMFPNVSFRVACLLS